MASAQHDADLLVTQLGTDITHHIQPGVVGLHHHIEQDQGDVGFIGHDGLGLMTRVGMQELDGFVIEPKLRQGHFGDAMDLGFVIDNENLPTLFDMARFYFFVIDNQDFIIHLLDPSRCTAAWQIHHIQRYQ